MLALQPQRQLQLLQLARDGALLGQEQVFRQLLRQRRAALRHAAMRHVGDHRAADADRIDAVMIVEAAVLDGDEGLRQIRRQFLQRHIGAGHARRGWRARCRRARRSGSSAAASGFPATGSTADARRPRPARRPPRSRPRCRRRRPNRTVCTIAPPIAPRDFVFFFAGFAAAACFAGASGFGLISFSSGGPIRSCSDSFRCDNGVDRSNFGSRRTPPFFLPNAIANAHTPERGSLGTPV